MYPPAGRPGGDKPVGHVRIRASSMAEATVEPCPHAGLPSPAKLEPGCRCEPVYLDYGSLRIPLAVDQAAQGKEAVLKKLDGDLRKLAERPDVLFRVIDRLDAAGGAGWAVQFRGGRLLLLPADLAHADRRLPIDARRTAADLRAAGRRPGDGAPGPPEPHRRRTC